ncbi:non-ribosomal peptide synthetase [Nocardiopsis sp. L17-MgMaSL7]|uniref:non-ribosomal peptide synthetase n=1 Tax=Nocardiopsis sp. L17-MgMaSL7 TaxID=1938893 RepID=UPI000D954AF4|nr:non-ribosomal peptide synthetase [Nocardiopsis sp. L17-MgMaSL7]PWV55402.1 amino acid adenylation domain-containing protein [Nocardiopsis sp. L17-MgMaSL7]
MSQPADPPTVPMTQGELRAAIAALVDLPPAEIGPDDDLFELGLDSIALMRLAARWRRAGLTVGFDELAEAASLRGWQRLLAPVTSSQGADPAGESPNEPFPLAAMQHAYWIGRQEGQPLGGVGAHFYAELDGTDVDPARLETAVTALRRRHGMLRVTVLDDGRQRVLDHPTTPALNVRDLTSETPERVDRVLAELRDHYTHRRMDVERGEVFDLALTLRPGGATRLHIDLDMLAADAASMRVLLRDLQLLYADPDAALPQIPLDYRSYLNATETTRAREREEDRAWWSENLESLSAPPALPTIVDPLDPDSATARFHPTTRLHHWLDPERKQQLLAAARRHRVTPAAALAGAFAEALGAWSDSPRFLLNLPLFHRDLDLDGAESLVGDFSSSILLDVDLTRERTFAESARHVQSRLRTAAAHGSYSGVEVLRDLSRAHDGVPTLAPVVYTSALGLGEIYDSAVRGTFGDPVWIISQGPQVWLDAQVTELDGGLLLNWDVRHHAFEPGVPEAAFAAYRDLVETLVDDAAAWSRPANPPLPEAQARVRETVNATDAPTVTERLHEGFFRAARERPDAPALLPDTGEPVTYAALAESAGRVSALLARAGVEPGDAVVVSLPRGVRQVAAVLGILGAGAAYIPIGVEQPTERTRRVLGVADAAAVLTDAAHTDRFTAPAPGRQGPPVVRIEDADRLAPVPPELHQSLDSTAYIIFTSGSTGTPKGVEVAHGAAMNTIAALNDHFDVGPHDRGLALADLDFDMSVYDLFAPLSAGGAVVLISDEARRDAHHWATMMRKHGVTLLNCVPALLDMVLTAAESHPDGLGDHLRFVLLGGDWVGLDQPARLRALAPEARFTALGGMTEAAVHSTVFEVDQVDPSWVSIPWGLPLPNMRARVVDHHGRDRPDWVAGELWVSGAGLATAYRGDPERTAEKFVTEQGRRWYRTGDRARYRSDGVLEFLGRADHQVKLRGHRIELGEVEAAAASTPGVSTAVALITGTPRRLALLAATGEGTAGEAELRATLERNLPSYMVPSQLVLVDALPLTTNGKPDRRRAEELAASANNRTPDEGDRAEEQSPRGWAETVVAEVWSELLGVRVIRRDDGFFALGGDSLLATRMIGALRERGAGGAGVARLFSSPTLADFAATLTRQAPPTGTTLGEGDHANRHQPFPMTDVQRAFWIGRDSRLSLGGVGTYHYSEFDGADFDLHRFERVWTILVERHEMLRAVFDEDGKQRILRQVPPVTVAVTEVDSEEEASTVLTRLREDASHLSIDLTRWPLFELRAVRYPSGGTTRTRLAIGLDYIVLDAASIIALYGELDRLYSDPETELEPIDVSFRDYVLQSEPDPDSVELARQHWMRRLRTLPPAPALPLVADPSTVEHPRFTRRQRPVHARSWQAITDKARAHGLTPSVVLLTCYAEVLSSWSDQPDVTVNLTLFNRQPVHPHIDLIMGDFTSVSLLGYEPRAGEPWTAAAHRLQLVMSEDLDNRDASVTWLLQELAKRTGAVDAAMPVVFSSSVGVGDRTVKDLSDGFPEKVWGISQTPQVLLDNQVTESHGGVMVTWDAIEELFRPGVLDAMFEAYNAMLAWLAENDWDTVAPTVLPRAQADARRPALGTAPAADTLHGEVLRQARKLPHSPAVLRTPQNESLTYGGLAARATRVAGGLAARGVGADDVVAVTLPPGADQVVAILGVLSTGAAYLLSDPGTPRSQREHEQRAAGARTVIVGSGHADEPDEVDLGDLVAADPLRGDVAADPGAPAYVTVDTGPDGHDTTVEFIEHRAVLATITAVRENFGIDAQDRMLAADPPSAGVSAFTVFGPLGVGGALVCSRADRTGSGAPSPAALVAEHGVTLWNGPPMLLEELITAASAHEGEPLRSLRLALVSGDRVSTGLPGRLRGASGGGARLVALHGGHGTAGWASAVESHSDTDGSVTSGRPLAGHQLHIVDSVGRERPDQVIGDLWIGQLHAQPEPALTGASGSPGRLRPAGVRARYLSDGTVEFLGPDPQAVLSGRRIDLSAVASALESHPHVTQSAVVTVGQGRERRLHAFMVTTGGEEPEGLSRHLADLLPPFAVPARLTRLPRLPLTADGAVDRGALTEAAVSEEHAASGPPTGETEIQIATLWKELLGTGADHRYADFFAAGGDSLTALRLVTATGEAFGVDVSVRSFLTASTLADLARQVDHALASRDEEESGTL